MSHTGQSSQSTQTIGIGLELDAEQEAAVTHGDGPALVLAGPGAGKTRVLTSRAAYLVRARGVPAERIAVCTFTVRATDEMRERLSALLGPQAGSLAVGTIHSLCYRLLKDYRRARRLSPLTVLAENTVHTLAGMLLDQETERNPLGMDLLRRQIRQVDLLRFFGACRNRLLGPEDVRPEDVPELVNGPGKDGDRWAQIQAACRWAGVRPLPEEGWIEAYRRFQAAKAQRGRLDFEDMALLLWQVWRSDPAALAEHQSRFRHVLIDEFQDTSFGQWEVLRRLAAPEDNVFAVGDADQSMYSFRYAEPRYTVRFRDYYPTAAVYPVGTNYRSLPGIVGHAGRLIAHNAERVPIELRAHRTHTGEAGGWMTVASYDDRTDEAEAVADSIAETCGGRWQDVAVLYRVRHYSARIELALLRRGIPYRIVGGLPFFRLQPVADLLAYLRLAEDPSDQAAFERAVQSPGRYLGRAFCQAVASEAGKGGNRLEACRRLLNTTLTLYGRQRAALEEFLALLAGLPDAPRRAIGAIRGSTGYDAWFLSRRADDEEEVEDQEGGGKELSVLNELEAVAAGFDTRAELLAYADLVLLESEREDDDGRVTLTTIHRAKGLEWPTVYVLGLAEGVLPHWRSLDRAEDLEEERRIAYVALTRARDRLLLSYPRRIGRRDVEPSRFLREMATEMSAL